MKIVNLRETRINLEHLLDAVAAGEEIVILRDGEPVAQLVSVLPEFVAFVDRSELRASLPTNESASNAVRSLRNSERY